MTTSTASLFEANRRLNDEEIKDRRTVLKSWPRELMAILTSRCNLECIMCTREVSNKLLPEDAAMKLTELFPYLETVDWQGGEAFTVPYLKKLITLAGEHEQLRQWITTSGILITKDWAEALVRSRVCLAVSIDGVTPATYEKIRVGARFETLLRNLEYLNEEAEKQGIRPRRELHATIMRSNFKEIDAFLDFAKLQRFEQVMFRPVMFVEDQENIFFHRDPEALAYLDEAAPRLERRARDLGLEFTWRIPRSTPAAASPRPAVSAAAPADIPRGPRPLLCKKPWKKLHINCISHGGNSYPECFCPDARNTGNLLTDSISDLWNSPMMQEYRRRLSEDRAEGFCSDVCVSGKVDAAMLSA